MQRYKSYLNSLLLGLLLIAGSAILKAETRIDHHYLYVELNPETHTLTGRDKLEITTTDRFWEFALSANLEVINLQIKGKTREYEIIPVDQKTGSRLSTVRIARKLLEKPDQVIDISYKGTFFEPADEVEFSREKIAMEITATISEEGAFLSPSGGFYPMADEKLSLYDTVIKLPMKWDAVSEGTLLDSRRSNGQTEVTYRTDHALDGIHITAAKWVVSSKTVDGVTFFTYFFEEDSSLAGEYLDMSIEYVKMYSEMLSPYPFSKFAVVENFFPTGYGMPSYTVLGRSVVRLPFIVYTSLGHEVLHNWWGNSVFVGDGGNWCEGLTTYLADYLYKLQSSESSARQYRKDILKDLTVYVNDGNEFPVGEFTSRTDDASRAIGYGKVAMIFHMLENQLGSETFQAGLKIILDNFQYKYATWDDFFTAFELAGDTNLADFKAQWIHGTSAPILSIETQGDALYLNQSDPVRAMNVEINTLDVAGNHTSSTLFIDSEQTVIPISNWGEISEVRVDENYNVLRKLHDSEMDPTIRETLSEENLVFIVPELTPEWKEIARSFNGYLSENSVADIRLHAPSDIPGTLVFLGTHPKSLDAMKLNGTFNVYGDELDASANCLVWAFKQSNGKPGLVIYSTDSRELIPVARKLPHYGKYGYLVFNHGQNTMKGFHQTQESPLVWRK
ncbi:MAG: hypothetical protein HQ510_10420 [Candidatus Marinimicrobia bacterium]|nr:hypothetical protein [Candidatus Neomarinimicrobiota bacterium]